VTLEWREKFLARSLAFDSPLRIISDPRLSKGGQTVGPEKVAKTGLDGPEKSPKILNLPRDAA